LGFKPEHTLAEELENMLADLAKHKHRLTEKIDKILPNVQWKA
jgi:hypothetical protein